MYPARVPSSFVRNFTGASCDALCKEGMSELESLSTAVMRSIKIQEPICSIPATMLPAPCDDPLRTMLFSHTIARE